MRPVKTCSALLLTMLTLAAPAAAQTVRAVSAGKSGGVLKPVLREDLPQGFAIHESATNSVTWPANALLDRFAHLPAAKDLIPHNVVYDCCCLQDTWLHK